MMLYDTNITLDQLRDLEDHAQSYGTSNDLEDIAQARLLIEKIAKRYEEKEEDDDE